MTKLKTRFIILLFISLICNRNLKLALYLILALCFFSFLNFIFFFLFWRVFSEIFLWQRLKVCFKRLPQQFIRIFCKTVIWWLLNISIFSLFRCFSFFQDLNNTMVYTNTLVYTFILQNNKMLHLVQSSKFAPC